MDPQNANQNVAMPHDSVKILVTQYSPETGEAIKQLSSLNFGHSQINSFSEPLVIKMNAIGVKKISDIKLCIICSSQSPNASGNKNSDNTVTSGNFGIEHSPMLSQKDYLTSFFSGFNSILSQHSEHNVLINNVSDTESEFIYLSVKNQDEINRGHLYFKWFFKFS